MDRVKGALYTTVPPIPVFAFYAPKYCRLQKKKCGPRAVVLMNRNGRNGGQHTSLDGKPASYENVRH